MAKEKEIQQMLKEFQAETRQQFNKIDKKFEGIDKKFDLIEKKIDEKAEETMRYFGMVAESLEHKIRVLAERVTATTEKIDSVQSKLEEHDQQFIEIKSELA